MSSPRNGKFGSRDGPRGEHRAADAEQCGRPPAGVLAQFARFFNEFLLLDQPAEIRLVHQPAREIGQNAAEIVHRQILGQGEVPQSMLLPSPVVWRHSA